MAVLIEADDLAEAIGTRGDVRILDVRWTLGGPAGLPQYRDGHIPGAVYVDLETELAGEASDEHGKAPLPAIGDLQEVARRWGVNDGDTVIVYDDDRGFAAARAWWLLRHAGIDDVRLLDGALTAWADAGHPLETGEVAPRRGDVRLAYGGVTVIDMDAAGGFPRTGLLLDARPAEHYTGEVEPFEARAGHIPGAISAPADDNLRSDGRFLPLAELRERYEALGLDDDTDVAVYCGAGAMCAIDAVALELLGHRAAVYPGSWSQWAAHPDRPIVVGSGPGLA